MIRPAELIQRKRDGGELTSAELHELMLGYARGEIPDYQLAAFCMAVYFKGLTSAETYAMTEAMIATGETVDLRAALGRKVVDKHSTGGVGDKTSIALGPIVSACGVPFAKMSGRGLGHTGGTLDKLESIPGFRVELSTDEFVGQVREAGMAIIGASADLVPADKRLYALRDVTATVDNYSLIAASIMSKKIAGGAEAIVVALLTDMDQPLGRAVGNALEIREAIATVRGEGPPDFLELVLAAGSRLLAVSDLGIDEAEGRVRTAQAIADGSAFDAYERWIRAQGGDPDEAALPTAPVVQELQADRDGFVTRLGAVAVGQAALHLGAGRSTKEDVIDHAVGVVCLRKRGDHVAKGEPLAEIHASTEAAAAEAARELEAAYKIGDEPPPSRPVVLDVLG